MKAIETDPRYRRTLFIAQTKRAAEGRRRLVWTAVCLLFFAICSCREDPSGALHDRILPVAVRSTTSMMTESSGAAVSGDTQNDPNREVVPGQIVVKFKSEGPLRVTQCVETSLRQGKSLSTATVDGSSSLDALFRRFPIKNARALIQSRVGLSTETAVKKLKTHLSSGAGSMTGGRALDADLVNIYRLDLLPNADLNAAITELSRDPHVEYAHPNYVIHADYTPDDPFLASFGSWGQSEDDLWGVKILGAEQAWDIARGDGIVVAVVDTGLDLRHPDISDNIWMNEDEIPDNGIDDDGNGYVDDVSGWNMSGDDNDPTDRAGHGTHVSGIIAAEDNNGIGIVGVAPNAEIMPIKSINDTGSASIFDLAEGIVYAVSNGARVINNSWGCSGGCPPMPVIEDAVSEAYESGGTVVFSAGNDKRDIKGYSPLNRFEPIVVGAITPELERASFSNFGFVDAAAPGAGTPDDYGVVLPEYGILSLKAENCWEIICSPGLIVDDDYLRLSGTSMAAPYVSGLAALILSQHPDYLPEQVRQTIRRSSADIGAVGFDTDFGYGLIDAAAALAEPTPPEVRLFTPPNLEEPLQVPVNGTASGPDFSSYVLEYGDGSNPDAWTIIQTSSSPVESGALGTWSVAEVPDGDHTLRLKVTTTDGREYEDRRPITLDRIHVTSPLSMSTHKEMSLSITGTAASAGMDHFALRVETLPDALPLAGAEIALTDDGKTPVQSSVLGVWNTEGTPAGHYQITLEVTMTTGQVLSESVPFIFDPREHDGRPVILRRDNQNYPVTEHAVLADVDGDLRDEEVVGYGRWVNVFRADGTELAGWPQTVDPNINLIAYVTGSPAVGDVDGDGYPDIVAPSNDGTLFMWHKDGTLHEGWPVQTSSVYTEQRITLADVDGDGVLDIIVTDSQNGFDVLDAAGESLPGFPVVSGRGLTGSPTAADLDGDGEVEIITVTGGYGPSILSAYSRTGDLLLGFPRLVGPMSSFGSHATVGDIDDDGDLEIAVTAANFDDMEAGVIAAYHHNGDLVLGWPIQIPSAGMSPPVLSDVDGDGSLEIAAGVAEAETGRDALYLWNGAGDLLPGWPVHSSRGTYSSSIPFSPPIVFDVDNDGRMEIIAARTTDFFGSTGPYGYPIEGYEIDGTPIPEVVRPTYGERNPEIDMCPGVGDMDGDGLMELTWIETRRFTTLDVLAHTWDLDTPASAAVSWPMFKRDARHSGVAEKVVPIVELRDKDRGKTRTVTGTARFRITTKAYGIIQILHPWGHHIQYAVDSDLLQKTPFNWGVRVQKEPSKEMLLRIVAPKAMKIRINWW